MSMGSRMTLITGLGSRPVSSYERSANDWYVEPTWAVDALIEAEKFVGTVFDPACGRGTIPMTFTAHGIAAGGSDICDRGFGQTRDFLDATYRPDVYEVVSNPPFNLAEQFIAKALDLGAVKVAMLLRLSFLEGKKRKAMFKSTPLARVRVFSSRVSMPPGHLLGSIKAANGTTAFAWFVWEHGYTGKPELGWL
jgi:hypothetical protein